MSNKVVHALYDDDDVLLSAVKTIRSEHYHIEEGLSRHHAHAPLVISLSRRLVDDIYAFGSSCCKSCSKKICSGAFPNTYE